VTIDTRSEQETIEAGRQLATRLSAGDVVLLYGDLGAGKTAFVRGLAQGLGASDRDVTSPTFTLIQEHRDGRVPLIHADLYRLTSREAVDIGLDEIGEDGVLAIEWADRLDVPPARAVRVRFEILDENSRRITISGN
jgi:tRNA threonylcarbamoyladenosine biosynthesis protein TsaE